MILKKNLISIFLLSAFVADASVVPPSSDSAEKQYLSFLQNKFTGFEEAITLSVVSDELRTWERMLELTARVLLALPYDNGSSSASPDAHLLTRIENGTLTIGYPIAVAALMGYLSFCLFTQSFAHDRMFFPEFFGFAAAAAVASATGGISYQIIARVKENCSKSRCKIRISQINDFLRLVRERIAEI